MLEGIPFFCQLMNFLKNFSSSHLFSFQELQNEVGALLEFRDVVMETFPHLRNKMVATSEPARVHTPPTGATAPRIKAKPRVPSSSAPAAASPPAAVAGAGWRDWGPGVRVRRKLKEPETKKTVQRQPKSSGGGGSGGEASSGGTASGSTVQDSGFSTETKDLHSSGTVTGLKSSATTSSASEAGRPPSAALPGEDELWELLEVIQTKGTRLRREVEELQTRLEGGEEDEGEVRRLRRERDLLLRRVAEMEAEAAGSEARVARLQDEAMVLAAQRRELEERLRAALSRKPEPDPRALLSRSSRVSGGSRRGSSVGVDRIPSGRASPCTPGKRPTSAGGSHPTTPESSEGGRVSRSSSFRAAAAAAAKKEAWECPPTLGALDGIVSNPEEVTTSTKGARRPDPKIIASILKEDSVLELRRHLLVIAMERETLRHKLEWLEEKSIELEGTRARIRMLESMQGRGETSPKQLANGFNSSAVPKEDVNGSSTESAHYIPSNSESSGMTRGRMQVPSSTHRTPSISSRTPSISSRTPSISSRTPSISSRTPPTSRTPPIPSRSRSQSRTGRISRIPLPPTKPRTGKTQSSPVGRVGSKSGDSMSSVSTVAANTTESSRKPVSINSDSSKSTTKTRVICLPHHYSNANVAHYRGTLSPSTRHPQSPTVSTVDHPFPDSLNASSNHPEYFDSVENRHWPKRKLANEEDYQSPVVSESSETFDSGRRFGGEGIYSPLADSLDDLPNSALEVEQCEEETRGVPNYWEVYGTVQSARGSKIVSQR
ncbi:hypothetical protein J437_LFUL006674 [Ladona fulva]|uniref:Uncharacterized protein n=1 Tax=Ladona fulva TaxID=123851 RepID=A0A8K0K7S7_LADFU|nr:hypothetical protein J437_LFUL006674 [Ladona fulva]